MQIKYSLVVLLGAISYGVLSTFVKLAYAEGYSVDEVVGSQIFIGWCLLVMAALIFSRKKVKLKSMTQLLLVGTTTSITGITYYSSLQYIPASIAIILLFQFTWMGVVLEAVVERKIPNRSKIISVFILIAGTLLASGMLETEIVHHSIMGIIFGLCAAISFTLFIYVSGKVATDIPPILKSTYLITGALFLTFIVFPPVFMIEGTLGQGLWKYSLPLALFGMVIPTIFFAIGVPKIGTGLGTILGAAELPTVIILSLIVLHEHVSPMQLLGVLLILYGIFIPQFKTREIVHNQVGIKE